MSSRCNVVILAAGRGQRFSDAGVTVPKPLLEFHGRRLLEHALDTAEGLRDSDGFSLHGQLIVVTTDAVAAEAHRAMNAGRIKGRRVVAVSEVQPGPVWSALLALAHLPEQEPVIFMDCDNFYSARRLPLPVGANFTTVATLEPGEDSSAFCCVVNARLREKTGETKLVVTGIYGFETAWRFRGAALDVLQRGFDDAPMSAVLQRAADAAETGLQFSLVDGWLPVGTPSQMRRANEASSS